MGKKVLIVDSSLYSRMILRDMLMAAGCSVCEARSGDDALENYDRLRPDIVMVSANTKGTSGPTVIEELRRRDPSLAAVICASAGQLSTVSHAFDAGASALCPKPYREGTVRNVLRRLAQQPDWK